MKNLALLVLLHCLFSFNVNLFSQWTLTNGPVGGGASKLAVFENYLFADQLLSTDNGTTWVLNGLSGFNSIVFNESCFFAATDNGIYLSTNNGTKWTQLNNDFPSASVHSLVVIKNNILAGSYGGIFLSTNNGVNWTKAGLDTMWSNSLVTDGNNVFASTKYGMYFSSDNGNNWTQKNNGLPDAIIYSPAIAGSYIYTLASDTVYYSANNGDNWKPTTHVSLPVTSLVADGFNIYAIVSDGIQVSADHGLTWNYTYKYPYPDFYFNVTAFAALGNNLYMGCYASIGRNYSSWIQVSTDSGSTWSNLTQSNSGVKALYANDYYVVAAKPNSIIYRLDIKESVWTDAHSYFESITINKFARNGNNVLMTASFNRVPGGLLISTDYGTNWSGLGLGSGYPMDANAIAVSGATIVVGAARYSTGGGGENGVYLSTDNGTSWNPPGLSNILIKCLAFSSGYLFAGTGNGVYRSSDNGINWDQVNNGLTDTTINALNIAGTSIIIASNSGVYRSANNGDNWTTANNGLANTLVKCITSDGSDIFLGTDNGVFLSTDDGTNWIPAGLSGLIINSLVLNQTDLYAATNAAGVCKRSLSDFALPVELTSFSAKISNTNIYLSWQTATEINNMGFNVERSPNKSDWTTISFVKGHGTTTSVTAYSYIDKLVQKAGKYYYRLKQIDNNGTYKYLSVVWINLNTPSVFALAQNYPNPFNPNTVISYSIPSASNIKLVVYNTLGQLIKTLETGYKQEGNYSISFNASVLPSGIYFYKLEAGSFTQIKKMVLMK